MDKCYEQFLNPGDYGKIILPAIDSGVLEKSYAVLNKKKDELLNNYL